jgi:endonuclease G
MATGEAAEHKQIQPYPTSVCYDTIYDMRLASLKVNKTEIKDSKRLVEALIPVCQAGYMVYFDGEARIPNVVYYKLNKIRTLGCAKRAEAFTSSPYVKTSVPPAIYKGSSYDKGHMAPSADLSWNESVERESYITINIAPQLAAFNRGLWKILERDVRHYVYLNNRANYIIITGAVYNKADPLLAEQVKVPRGFYKILLDTTDMSYMAWYIPHHVVLEKALENSILLDKYRETIETLEAYANMDFVFQLNKVKFKELPRNSSEALIRAMNNAYINFKRDKTTYCSRGRNV